MAKDSNLETYVDHESGHAEPSGWMKIGLVAIASVVLGGMATVWWYRKTLIRLRQAGESATNSQFGISDSDSADEI